MAHVRQDRGAFLPGSAPGRKSIAVLVAALAVVLVAIALMLNFSRRQASHSPAAIENATPAAGLLAAAGPQPAPAVVPASDDDDDEDATPPRKKTTIARAVADGRPGLAACYQRALVKDETLVHGKVTVRVSLASSGRVDAVGVNGPAAFRTMQPCLQKTISKWNFPAAPAAYTAEFPLVMQGSL